MTSYQELTATSASLRQFAASRAAAAASTTKIDRHDALRLKVDDIALRYLRRQSVCKFSRPIAVRQYEFQNG